MNILFVLYGDFMSNSANPLALYARELQAVGHSCAIAVPTNLEESVKQYEDRAFLPVLYGDVLAAPDSVFPDGRPADVIHACTPREIVREFITSYMARRPAPLVIYLEDNEGWISSQALNVANASRLTEKEVSERLPKSVSHPFRYDSFIGLADAVAVIQDKLKSEVPPWVHCETVMLGVDLDFFSPRPPDPSLRTQYGVHGDERVIAYHGGLDHFKRPAIETLCRAVGMINRQGYPCRLLRTGIRPLDFVDQLPPENRSKINDLGLLPKSELPNILALADVFVQPGKIDPFEDLRLPGKVPEFLAMARPVVMPDVNIAHLFTDGVDAVLLRMGSAEEIADKCIGLFSDPEKADAIGRAGRLLAEKYFDVRSQACRLEGVYKTACNNFNPAIASKVWQEEGQGSPVTLLLARKLRLLADLCGSHCGFEVVEMVRTHEKYMEQLHQRVKGLETSIEERDALVASLLNSLSWKITRPLRVMSSLVRTIKRGGGLKNTFKKAIRLCRREGLAGIRRCFKIIATWGQIIPTLGSGECDRNDYAEWIRRYDTLTDETRATMRARIDDFPHTPLISVVMPTYNPKPEWLTEAIESVRMQIYPHWELCIADDASTDKAIRLILERYASEDSRIKVVFREQNGHISAASNSALELATGGWVALLDHDDLLGEHALFWVADAIQQNPDARVIYSDEDKIYEGGRRFDPYFKCDWNVDLFYSHNLITHLGVYRLDLLKAIGGFRVGLEGAQDYDLALRCIERIEPKQIHHIPRVLYHWRTHAESTAESAGAKPYAVLAGERALNEHFQRQRLNARAEFIGYGYRLRYALPDSPPMVTLIIPSRNGLQLIRRCVESIREKTTYPNYEILIVDNGSDDPATLQYFKALQSKAKVRVVRDDRPFNYSALNNAAVKLAQGEVLGLLNNDLEVISPEWLSEMASFALQPGVGAVGARLWYPDKALQHGGVILGVGGIASHSHKNLPRHQYGYFSRASLIQSLSAVTAACLVIRKAIYEEVGGLNETDLAVAFNDIDFCLCVREAGYRNVWTPYAELYHYESATRGYEDTPEKQARLAKEGQYMKQRWGDLLLNDPAYSPNLTLNHEDFSLAWPPRVELLASSELSSRQL